MFLHYVPVSFIFLNLSPCVHIGRESPLPLTIKGEGMGPKLKLKYKLMDMKNVFLGDKYSFEVNIFRTVWSVINPYNVQMYMFNCMLIFVYFVYDSKQLRE